MISEAVQYKGATITVRREDVRARLLSEILLSKFSDTDELLKDIPYYLLGTFVRFVTQTTIEGDLGFYVPRASDDPTTIHAAFEAFLAQDSDLIEIVRPALDRVDAKKKTPGRKQRGKTARQ